jgi:hypothetical protein
MSEEVRMVRKTLMSRGAVARIERELEPDRNCELPAAQIIYWGKRKQGFWRLLFKYSGLASNPRKKQ